MAEHPILMLPQAREADREKKGGRGKGLSRPTPLQQATRLSTKLQSIVSGFDALQAKASGFEPERVVVFETVGSLTDVARVARAIPGLEWLEEVDIEQIEPVGGFAVKGEPEKALPARLFAVMSNQQAMRDLIKLWDKWPKEWEGQTAAGVQRRVEKGFGPFKQLFRHLIDVRYWGPRDRVQDTFRPWVGRVSIHGKRPIKFEAELWYREKEQDQRRAANIVDRLISKVGGRKISSCVIPAIRYHGLLLEAPADTVAAISEQIVNDEQGGLVRCEDVMFFRPGPQNVAEILDEEGVELAHARAGLPVRGGPTVALLDGMPLSRHEALDGHLVIDDPDDIASKYRPGQQHHGTAMASLIIHGDLEDESAVSLGRPIYVRPVLEPVEQSPGSYAEQFPEDCLFLDVIHRAVRRIFEGEGDTPAVAPGVRIINLSLGNPWQRFDRHLSPLAKLIDWLSSKYNVLFIVAAGNQMQSIELSCSWSELKELDSSKAASMVLRAMYEDQSQRRLFSPAESVNAICVGAVHTDRCLDEPRGYQFDPFDGAIQVSPLNTVASGFRRSVKPDILMPGGRQWYSPRVESSNKTTTLEIVFSKRGPGHRVAAPGQRPGDISKYWFVRGTSNSTALATRSAAIILDRLELMRAEPGGDVLGDELLHVATKALLVHGCSWGDISSSVECLAPDSSSWHAKRKLVARFLGYGPSQLDRSLVSTDQRVLLLGGSRIGSDEGHEYFLPLPPSISGLKSQRRLTTTLAWMTPINPLHRDYRRASLFLKVLGDDLGFVSTGEVHDQLSSVGTVQHIVYSTDRAIPVISGSSLKIKVNCRAAAGQLHESVPYALAVTLEVAEPFGVSIYEEVRQLIRERARVR